MDLIGGQTLALGFLRSCERSFNTKRKRVLQNIPQEKKRELQKKLAEIINSLPEAEIRAASTESVLVYNSWAINQRASHEVVHGYDKYRAEVEKLLTDALIAFLQSQP